MPEAFGPMMMTRSLNETSKVRKLRQFFSTSLEMIIENQLYPDRPSRLQESEKVGEGLKGGGLPMRRVEYSDGGGSQPRDRAASA